ncbi:hypothetical protein MIDIC_110102 [Alphaproteobacteria bacterium]
MGRSCSKDFKEIALKQIEDGEGIEEVCMVLGISKTSVFC